MKLTSLFLCILIAAFIHSAHANVLVRPKVASELGFTFLQKAYRIKGKVLWMNETALKRDFPALKGLSSKEIETLILENFSLLTETQLDLKGIVTTPFQTEKAFRKIYHPTQYIRAGVLEFEVPGVTKNAGLVDTKGTGYSPEGMQRVKDYFSPVLKLRGEAPITEKDLQWATKQLDLYKEDLKKETEAHKPDLSEIEERGYRHAVHQVRKRVQLFSILEAAYKRALEGQPLDPSDEEQYLETLRKLDYINGSIPAERLLKEVLVQNAVQTVFKKYNARTKSHLQTVENYFVIELPFNIHAPEGERPAGIIGRQSHWRFGNVRDFEIPEEVGVYDELTDICQTDIFGAVVDFENVTLPILGKNYGSGVIAKRIQEALSSNFLWRGRAIKKALAKTVAEAEEASYPKNLEFHKLLDPKDELPDFKVVERVLNGTITAEQLHNLSDSYSIGNFLAAILQLMHQDAAAAAQVIRNLVLSHFKFTPGFFRELLLPLAELDEKEFAKTIATFIKICAEERDLEKLLHPDENDQTADPNLFYFRKNFVGTASALTYEFVKRQSFDQFALNDKLWFSPESKAYIFLMIWMQMYIEKKHPEEELQMFLEQVSQAFPEDMRQGFLRVVQNTAKIYEGTASLKSLTLGCKTALTSEAASKHPQQK